MESGDFPATTIPVDYRGRTFSFAHSDPDDHILALLRSTRSFYELELLETILAYLSPGDLVLDVGANIGTHAVFFAGVAECKVIAFEPNPKAAALLRVNARLNGLESLIEVRECAVGRGPHRAAIEDGPTHNLGMTKLVDDPEGSVEVLPLDQLCAGAGRVAFLKIDVEGMESQVLHGAAHLLAQYRPALSVEAATPGAYAEIVARLRSFDYQPAGSFNYTPTHLFATSEAIRSRPEALGEAGHRAALGHIAGSVRQQSIDQRLATAARRLAALEAGAQRQDKAHAAAAADAQRRLDALEGEAQRQDKARTETEAEARRRLSALEAETRNRIASVEGALRMLEASETRARLRFEAQWEARNLTALMTTKIAEASFSAVEAPQPETPEQAAFARALAVLGKAPAAPAKPEPGSPPTRDVWFVQGAPARRVTPPPSLEPAPGALAEVDFTGGWDRRGWAQGASRLEPNGVISLPEGADDNLGVVGALHPFKGGGIVEVEVEAETLGGLPGGLLLQIRTEKGERVGPDVALDEGKTVHRAFAVARTEALKLYVRRPGSEPGDAFRLKSMRLRRISAEAHRARVRSRIRQPVIASMASIPGRREMLRDCVASLLTQCDLIRVFLNNYSETPDFLKHPRIETRRSQDWDDRGDAGKVFWMGQDEAAEGYRLIVDDDLVFPPDFAETMTEKVAASGDRAIYATHGVLLKQPFDRYYEPSSRAATFHFAHGLEEDRGVHIGATNALCLHVGAVRMRWDEFSYCNSADVWLALHAQRAGIPVLTPKRAPYWVIENRHADPSDTIYNHALKRTRTRFDSSLVQDAALRHACPMTIHPLPPRRKYGLAIHATDPGQLSDALNAWRQVRRLDDEWIVLIACAAEDPALSAALAETKLEHETHLLPASTAEAALREVAALHRRLGLNATMVIPAGSRSHIDEAAPEAAAEPVRADDLLLEKAAGGLLLAADAPALAALRGALKTLRIGGPGLPGAAASLLASSPPLPSRPSGPVRVNDLFERVRVFNLDRRPDRWAASRARLERIGVCAERIAATDGRDPDVAEEYEAYARQPLRVVGSDVPPVRSARDLYLNYSSQSARIAHIEQSSGAKAIASAGAWGYLRTYEAALEEALEARVESLLLFDDDVAFHKDFVALFDAAARRLPADWLILQLGTLQYDWRAPWVEWRGPGLYQNNGGSIGSHAVGMRFEAMPFLLDHVKRMDLPFDVGALSAITRAFADRCFVIHPNLAIQSLKDSDIGTSGFQKNRDTAEIAARYRWRLDDYDMVEHAEATAS